ncbi:MAG: CpsD/CapB family tyrosine-protein kinase [Clostridia bacterium]|nr:CpsD/CapB family tyrosine-protein kinase [Clostridia bacterium]
MENVYEGKLLSDSTPFAISEAFKALRTNLFYTAKGEKCPVFGITSTFSHSGKSLIISNLAVSYAQLEKKVLLIDCDLRNSSVHKIFKIERAGGMSELLAGADTNLDKYIKRSSYQNLSIITSGGTPPNPAELLASTRMAKFIAFMKQHYDIIFIDLPPIAAVSDAMVISDHVTGYLFAVRSGIDDTKALSYALSAMEQTNSNVVGFVMNDIDSKTSGYYGSRYGRYGHYYRYGRYGRYGKYGYGKRYGYGYGRKYGYGYGYGYGHNKKQ